MIGRPHIFILLAVLILAGMIVSPVYASTQIVTTGYFPDAEMAFEGDNLYNFTYSVNSSQAISNIQFKAPKGTELNYTITYGAGNSLSGYITYLPGDIDVFGFGEGVTTINIGESTDTRSFVDTGLIPKWEIVGYAREEDSNGTVLSTGYAIYDVSLGVGFQSGFIAYQCVEDLQPIESMTFTSNMPVWLFIGTSDRQEIQEGISKTLLDTANEWIQLAIDISWLVLDLVVGLLAWLKFFFVDNLVMTISLYLAITMAYSACTCRNIFQFFRKFFNDQRKLFEFIIGLWTALVNIISSFRRIF